jgi:hypothetical protein
MPTFYRIVRSNPPTMLDFTSLFAQGVSVRTADAESLRLHSGISVSATEQQARNRAHDMPWLGRFIARLEIPAGSAIRYERTLRTRGHHTLWGEPAELLRCVVAVIPASLLD